MAIGNLLLAARKAKHLTRQQVADHVGVSPQAVYKWERDIANPQLDKMQLLQEILDISGENAVVPEIERDTISLPVYGARASAGTGELAPDGDSVIQSVSVSPRKLRMLCACSSPKNLGIISIKGDSMSPTLQDGDFVLVDLGVSRYEADAMYVVNINDNLFVKRLQGLLNTVRIISDNPVYQPFEAAFNEVRIIGKVLGVVGLKLF